MPGVFAEEGAGVTYRNQCNGRKFRRKWRRIRRLKRSKDLLYSFMRRQYEPPPKWMTDDAWTFKARDVVEGAAAMSKAVLLDFDRTWGKK